MIQSNSVSPYDGSPCQRFADRMTDGNQVTLDAMTAIQLLHKIRSCNTDAYMTAKLLLFGQDES